MANWLMTGMWFHCVLSVSHPTPTSTISFGLLGPWGYTLLVVFHEPCSRLLVPRTLAYGATIPSSEPRFLQTCPRVISKMCNNRSGIAVAYTPSGDPKPCRARHVPGSMMGQTEPYRSLDLLQAFLLLKPRETFVYTPDSGRAPRISTLFGEFFSPSYS